MPARVTEKWSMRTFSRGKAARRVFWVDGGPTTDAQAQTEVVTANSVSYGSQHPLDAALTVPSGGIDVELIVPGLYQVTANYEANAVSGDTTSLFTKKWQVLPTEIIYEDVAADLAVSTPQAPPTLPAVLTRVAITSSAMRPIGDEFSRRISYYRFRLRRYETGTDLLTKNLAYQNKWNYDTVTLPRYGNATRGQLRVISIGQVDAQEQGASTGVLVEYVLEARPTRMVKYGSNAAVEIHAWHRRILDKDMQANAGTLAAPIYCKIYSKHQSPPEEITEPVMFDGKGWPLKYDNYIIMKRNATTGEEEIATPPAIGPPTGCEPESSPYGADLSDAAAIFLNWDTTEGPESFSGLNIAANL